MSSNAELLLLRQDRPKGKPTKYAHGKNLAKYSRATRLEAKGLDPNTPKPKKVKKPKAEKEAARCAALHTASCEAALAVVGCAAAAAATCATKPSAMIG